MIKFKDHLYWLTVFGGETESSVRDLSRGTLVLNLHEDDVYEREVHAHEQRSRQYVGYQLHELSCASQSATLHIVIVEYTMEKTSLTD